MTSIAAIKQHVFDWVDPWLGVNLSILGVKVYVTELDHASALQIKVIRGYSVADSAQWQNRLQHRIQQVCGTVKLSVEVVQNITPRQPIQAKKHPKINNVIAILSGKGGVGKSTVTTLLAVALVQQNFNVGILDADIHGPSQILMMGPDQRSHPDVDHPAQCHGVHMASMGAYLSVGQPAAWRGPMASKALVQLYQQTQWPELDFLCIDCPPGTSDILMTIARDIPVVGGVLVTTPQVASVMDAERAGRLMHKLNLPILGVIENMSGHTCTGCGQHESTFGQDGGKVLAQSLDTVCWGQLPLNAVICQGGEQGLPGLDGMDQAVDWVHWLTKSLLSLDKFNRLSMMAVKVEAKKSVTTS